MTGRVACSTANVLQASIAATMSRVGGGHPAAEAVRMLVSRRVSP